VMRLDHTNVFQFSPPRTFAHPLTDALRNARERFWRRPSRPK